MPKENEAENQNAETAEAAAPTPDAATGSVMVTITKHGSGKVSTGVHVPEQGDVMAQRGDVLEVSEDTAASLEAKGYAES